MADKMLYVCSNCGYTTTKWYGKCPNCKEWGTLEEQQEIKKNKTVKRDYKKPKRIVDVDEQEEVLRVDNDFDQFLSKGFVKGGVYLISGTPGVGKSTLLLQIAQKVTKYGFNVVYVSAEESLNQVSMRAKRLGVNDIFVVSDNDIDSIMEMACSVKPDMLIIDSIHTVHSNELDALSGGVQQVRYSAERIIEIAKVYNIATIIVAHVTKEGNIAGPKMLEHMVDSVLFLDGEEDNRVLKIQKNRFGSSEESLIMEMRKDGLKVIKDPTLKFVNDKEPSDGKVYGMVVEGRYPLIVEAQALCIETPLAIPRRVAVGFELNRLHMLLAVIEKKLNIPMFKYDVYLNMAGGVKVTSTLVDAALVSCIVSSIKKIVIPKNTVVVGELDLSGNIRMLKKYEKHISKVEALGFRVISSKSGVDSIPKLARIIKSSL